jgi:uncharacterized protein YbjT (DUF2867 family)
MLSACCVMMSGLKMDVQSLGLELTAAARAAEATGAVSTPNIGFVGATAAEQHDDSHSFRGHAACTAAIVEDFWGGEQQQASAEGDGW